ncbi:MAG TPA: beta-propeller fold lactonase family protein [Candidatus Babeliales bacterium]|nr:beta-propeller fold lactonase family protein [Candidatus Babeliales bacterium]
MRIAQLYFIFFIVAQQSLIIHTSFVGSFQEIASSPFSAGTNPASSAFSPITTFGKLFAAVPNFGSANISTYTVDQTTGFLTPAPGSPVACGNQPTYLAFSPITTAGNLFAAVTNFADGDISTYLVDQNTGAFTPIATVFTGTQPSGVAFSPIASGNLYLAVPNTGLVSNLSIYSVNQTTGALALISAFSIGNTAKLVACSPIIATGNLLVAVVNQGDNTVSVFNINPVFNIAFLVGTFATGPSPIGVAFAPVPLTGGDFLAAVTNNGDGTVSVYSVNQATGVFTPIGSPVAAGSGANNVAFSPLIAGELFAAVVNFNSSNVSVYQVDRTTGFFTPLGDSPYATGAQPDGINYSPKVGSKFFAITGNFGSDDASVFEVSTQSCNALTVYLTINPS